MQRLWATRYSHARRLISRCVGAQRAVGPHEHVLHHVLGVLARAGGEHLAHVGEQPLAVAVVEDPERVLVAAAEEREQLLVGAQPQQRRAKRNPAQARCVKG